MKNTKKRGFTIVELVVVIAVIAILASVLIPTFSGVVTKAKESAALQDARNAWTAYLVDHYDEISTGTFCIKSGDLYFKVVNGQFTGDKCTENSHTKVYTVKDGTLEAPAAGEGTGGGAGN